MHDKDDLMADKHQWKQNDSYRWENITKVHVNIVYACVHVVVQVARKLKMAQSALRHWQEDQISVRRRVQVIWNDFRVQQFGRYR